MNMTRLRAIAAPLLAIGLLGACGSSGTNTASPTPAPSRSTTTKTLSTTATTAAPKKSGAVTPDLAVLKGAANAYFEAHDKAIRAGDTTAFRRTFTNRCRICAADAADLDRYARMGQALRGGRHRISSPSLLKVSPGGGILIISIHQDPSSLVDASGKTVNTFESSDVPRAYLQFRLTDQKWILTGAIVG